MTQVGLSVKGNKSVLPSELYVNCGTPGYSLLQFKTLGDASEPKEAWVSKRQPILCACTHKQDQVPGQTCFINCDKGSGFKCWDYQGFSAYVALLCYHGTAAGWARLSVQQHLQSCRWFTEAQCLILNEPEGSRYLKCPKSNVPSFLSLSKKQTSMHCYCRMCTREGWEQIGIGQVNKVGKQEKREWRDFRGMGHVRSVYAHMLEKAVYLPATGSSLGK